MKAVWLPMLLLLLVDAGIFDPYIWTALRKRAGRVWLAKVFLVLSLALAALCIVILSIHPATAPPELFRTFMWLLFIYITCFVAKGIWIIIDLISRLPRLWGKTRWRRLSKAGVVVAFIALAVAWYGALIGRLQIDESFTTVEIPDLPEAFDGYRIAQISDLHVGTFGTDTAFISRLVDRVNATGPDLIVFTGDIVNRVPSELPPFLSPLSRLHAPDGVISIPGNHDHLDYGGYATETERRAAFASLMAMLRDKAGWKVMLDSAAVMRRNDGADSLVIVGVQNMGDGKHPHYGSLLRAYATPGDSAVKVLLTHNPRHWADSVMDNPGMRYALTLSGHTHAMQMRVLGISPAALRFDQWGGLYASPDSARRLYVNIGAGTVGVPARIGATPEISVITLRREPNCGNNANAIR